MSRVIKTETLYEGFFFELDEDEFMYSPWVNSKLENRIDTPHITVYYKPSQSHEIYYGQKGRFEFYEYGCDDNNEGYKVRCVGDDDLVQHLLKNVDIPHVTVSVSSNGRPKDTKKLNFVACEPYVYEAIFGAMEVWYYDDGSKVIVMRQDKGRYS